MRTSFIFLSMLGSLILITAPLMGDWSQVQPIPVRAAMNAVDHFPSTTTVVAAADSGIVYRSTDGGVLWEQSIVSSVNMNAISCYGNQFAVTAGDSGTLAITTDSGDSWSSVTLATSADVVSVSTHDDSTFALGFDDGEIWTTEDRGNTWIIGTTPAINQVYAIDYVNENEIWAAAGISAWKTTDGGQIWTSIRNFSVSNLTDVVFLNDQTGFYCGIYGDVYRTRDGGATWDSTSYSMLLEPIALVALDSTQVRVVGRRGNFLHSDSSFHTWSYEKIGGSYTDLTYLDLQDIYLAVGGEGTFAGAGGYGAIASRSIDQGSTWTYTKYHQEVHLRSIFFLDENEGWAAGGVDFQSFGAAPEIVVHTTDGGYSWQTILMEAGGGGLTDIYFLDSDTGWALSNNRIWGTTNGGQDWDQALASSANSLSFINSQEGWYCGIGGIIRHTTDAGANWSAQFAPSNADYLYSIDFIDDQNGWCSGYNWQNHTGIILHTNNGGANWYYQYSEVHATGFRSIRSIDMLDTEQGIGVSIYGTILETIIGDTNWNETTAPDSTPLNAVRYQSEQVAWAAGDDGYIIFKTPLAAWQVDTVLSEHRIMDIHVIDQDHRYASTDQGIVLVYTPEQSVGDDITKIIPQEFALYQNYPNPFNPSTEIRFDLRENTHVTLAVYNILGQKIWTLVDKPLDAGSHLVNFNGSSLASGVYFYKINASNFTDIKKMVMIK